MVIVASVASVAIIVSMLVLIFVLRKKKSLSVEGNLQESLIKSRNEKNSMDSFSYIPTFFSSL